MKRCRRKVSGGGGGIRTHGAHRTRDFQSRPLGLYGTPPGDRAMRQMPKRRATSRPLAAPRPTGGESGIRTHGALFRLAAFRERYHKPLGHLSAAQYSTAPGGISSIAAA